MCVRRIVTVGRKNMSKWIQAAEESMEERGTKGSFGKATSKKIASAKKQGGKMAKKAIFAQNMKAIARKHSMEK
jgi:hypothetical protein